ncbi:MAG: translocation/assembly module TamB [Muribaculaceae bacterium]|nr:translocation/assembly module TamB [Muribaculaceae bacterium]
MKWFYRIFRAICVTLIALAVAVPLFIYVLLTLPPVQQSMCSKAEKELSTLLDTKVTIKTLSVAPFNRVSLRDVTVFDQGNDTVLKVNSILAGVRLSSLFSGEKIIVDYGSLIGPQIKLYRETPQSSLNIDHIIKAVSPKERQKRESKFDLTINTVVIRRATVSYDVKSVDETTGRFNPSHILVSDFNADISLPHMANNDFAIDINRITFNSRDEFEVDDFHGNFVISDKLLAISEMAIKMPRTQLVFDNTSLEFSGWNDILPSLDRNNIPVNIAEGSYVTPADFALFSPQLKNIDTRVDIEVKASGSLNEMRIGDIKIDIAGQRLGAQFGGKAGNFHNPDSLTFNLTTCRVFGNGSDLARMIAHFTELTPDAVKFLSNIGEFSLNSNINGSVQHAVVKSHLSSEIGGIDFNGDYKATSLKNPSFASGNIETRRFDLGKLLPKCELGRISAKIKGDYDFGKTGGNAKVDARFKTIEFKGVPYTDLTAYAVMRNRMIDFNAEIADSLANFDVKGRINTDSQHPSGNIVAYLDYLDLNGMKLTKDYDGYELSGRLFGSFEGADPDTAHVELKINNLNFRALNKPSINMKQLTFKADGGEAPTSMRLRSDYVDAHLDGSYSFKQIIPEFKDIASQVFPILFDDSIEEHSKARHHSSVEKRVDRRGANDFVLDMTFKYNEELNQFLKLPVHVIYPVKIHTRFDSKSRLLAGYLDAPYLQQNNKLIEDTHLSFGIDPDLKIFDASATTKVPTADGLMTLKLDCDAADNRIDTYFKWNIDRQRAYNGKIDLSTLISKTDDNRLMADVTINPGSLMFNDAVWTINKAEIKAQTNRVEIENIDVRRDNQFIVMNGVASDNSEDVLELDLLDVNLDYIFESLGIEKAMIGGDATGSFYASSLFTTEPVITTPGLDVKNISYNKVVFGDAVVKSSFDTDTHGITLDAIISQPDGQKSAINGAIYPFTESLDLHFNCTDIPVGFLRPYMSAFTSEVSGYASGYAHLFGTFKYIDLEGDVFARDLKLKLDFTNTVYSCTDSVKMTPGRIDINNVTLYDIYGNTANLNGEVTHKFFKEPAFDFRITDAQEFLAYDVNSTINPDWYGHIFTNGSAQVTGEPGIVDIKVNMTTAPNSTFTFVLSDAAEASEYSFVTLRDRRKLAYNDSIEAADPTPKIVKELKKRINRSEEGNPSVYNMEFLIGVTPAATIYLVMDPVGGDRIRANGSGNLRMTYGSANEDLRMYGKYTLDKGSYNFTLQDIIIKDFTIKPGSSIAFNGDPFAAQLDISATYSVNANLSDLDESFLQDKDLNRTNVPVHALMQVTGDIHEPEIKFDLEFPTLTSDIYRKVKSIVSTDDMMNRQIIYLLALNRFYTPDYMSSTTKGNELVSVASSTISSQLSSILGQLSDNWSIAPNIRSDRGDFSDVEFDLALSSNLLNNRLLFNGNFGYRDKTLNTNQFVGDFDLEYLLNKSGSLRLKAYNRYNDQNYYVKTATTTQGIGVMVKKDFDNLSSLIKPLFRRKKKNQQKEAAQESQPVEIIQEDEVVVDDFITIKNKNEENKQSNTTHNGDNQLNQ